MKSILSGIYDLITQKKFNFLSLLGFISVLLTGAIGLLELNASMIAVKEAFIPLIIGVLIIILKNTRYSLVENLLPKILDFEKIKSNLESEEAQRLFKDLLGKFNYFMASTFLVSAILNYALARYIVTADSGTKEFNKQIGEMTALSFPVIAIPTSILFVVFLLYLFKKLTAITSLSTDEMILNPKK